MSARGIFQGYGLQGVDEKGRVAIPSCLRQTVEANNALFPDVEGRTLLVAPSEDQTCLIAYDRGYTAELAKDLKRRSREAVKPGEALDRAVFRISNGLVDTFPFDQSGRFVLQGYPRKFAQIGKLALFLAVGPYFEIWDPQTLLTERGEDRQLTGLVEYLLEERGAK